MKSTTYRSLHIWTQQYPDIAWLQRRTNPLQDRSCWIESLLGIQVILDASKITKKEHGTFAHT